MATVITNLLSAIPFIGNDVVPFLILPPLYFIYIFNFYYKSIITLYLIILKSPPLGGGVLSIKLSNKYTKFKRFISTYIWKVYTLKEIKLKLKLTDDQLTLLLKFIGFIDGKGYIRITKKSKLNKTNKIIDEIYISLIINLNENELDLLKYFKLKLQLGKVYTITPKKGKKIARLEINKTDLKNIFLPLLIKYNIQFLTITRQKQFLLMRYILDNNIIYYKNIINNDKINNYINNNIIKYDFNKLYYFNNWLVGFTMAEGSFINKNNKSKDMCYQLKQKYNFKLFESIKIFFNLNKCLNIHNNKYIQLNISSIKDIQKIIIFFENNKLLGYKLIQYKKWLLDLEINNRYKNIKYKI